jgi:hypothetical protein
MKLKSKERNGSQVKKYYDQPLTPYQRVLQAKLVSKAAKDRLRAKYLMRNPAALKRKIERLQQRLALPIRTCTGVGARVALQRCPILRAGDQNSSIT